MTDEIEYLANIIEGRILAEKRKHPTLDWIKIASRKIAGDILRRDQAQHTEKLSMDSVAGLLCKTAREKGYRVVGKFTLEKIKP